MHELSRSKVLGRRRIVASLGVSAALCAFCAEVPAQAQTVAINKTQVTRDPVATRNSPYNWDVNRAECENGDVFTFPLTFQDFSSSYTFEVWGTAQGGDCTKQEARTGANKTCYQLSKSGFPSSGAKVGEVSVTAAEMAGFSTNTEIQACGGTTTTGAETKVTIFFMLMASGATSGTHATWDSTKLDFWGPAAPTDISLSAEDASLKISYAKPTDTDFNTIVAYCAADGAVLGSGGGGGGGSGGGGGGGGGSGGAGCGEGIFKEGALPDLSWTPCAEGTLINNLENNKTYAVAIASRDTRGNVGPLAAPVCAAPVPIDDFFEVYNDLGGKGGGGFCSVSFGSATRPALAALGLLATALAFGVRRRAKRANGREAS